MDDTQRYLFDLQGYLVLKNVVPRPLIDACNAVMDRIEQMAPGQYPNGVTLGKPRTPNELYITNAVEADPVLNGFIDLPEVIDIIADVSLNLYRLNHAYAIYRWGTGYTYLHMGGAPLHPKATYMCHGGQIFSTLTKAVFPIQNNGIDDGCFAAVPGSHKANFTRPFGDHPSENPPLVPIPGEPGDAIVFTEATTHGSYVNTSGRPRRTIYFCYSVGYMPDWGKLGLTFTEPFMATLTDRQRDIVRLKDR
jgi:ectoine hydroxylase-related dioxygenase (phytanoyl-CoA dioxygenase family)